MKFSKCLKTVVLLFFVSMGLPIVLFFISPWFVPEWWGSHSLGNNIYLMDWDNNQQIIVWGTHIEGNVCSGGLYIIPDEKNIPNETLLWVKDMGMEIFAKTTHNDRFKYYVLDKRFDPKTIEYDSVIKFHKREFQDSVDFYKEYKKVKGYKKNRFR